MLLTIIDPGYEHSSGHHESANLGIARDVTRYGWKVHIIAAKNLTDSALQHCLKKGVEVTPFFTTPCYPENPENLTTDVYEALSRSFAGELRHLLQSGVIRPETQVLMHTGYSFHMQGWGRALWHDGASLNCQLLVTQMFNPGAFIANENPNRQEVVNPRNYLRYKLSLKLLTAAIHRHNLPFHMATSCRSYQRIYQTLWKDGVVGIHPGVVSHEHLTAVKNKPDNPMVPDRVRILFYLGSVKEEKGFSFSARLAMQCVRIMPDITAVFHFNDDFPGAGYFEELYKELQTTAEQYHNLEIHTGYLPAEGYTALLQASHVLCLLYDPEYYRLKTSGLFWEALPLRKLAWLVSDSTWNASELSELNIAYKTVPFSDIDATRQAIVETVRLIKSGPALEQKDYLNNAYLEVLTGSFGEYLYNKFQSFKNNQKKLVANTRIEQKKKRILVVRTDYAHFSSISGPAGFIPHLQALGYEVDEQLIPPGSNEYRKTYKEEKYTPHTNPHDYISYYQLNSFLFEEQLLKAGTEKYDVIHFLDGEHCGVLTALNRLKESESAVTPHTTLIATFHQPQSILSEIIKRPEYLTGFDTVHILSPCQRQFFAQIKSNDPDFVKLVAHGVAPELFMDEIPESGDKNQLKLRSQITGNPTKRNIILTVGNWLRNFDALQQTAKQLADRKDILFVIVSKGLNFPEILEGNIILFNKGISDIELHKLYQQADILFLPLKDGAANNAVLEAMAHGLPIVTTDLPSIHYYTNSLVKTCSPDPALYRNALEAILDKFKDQNDCRELSDKLVRRANDLTWSKIALEMHKLLYQ